MDTRVAQRRPCGRSLFLVTAAAPLRQSPPATAAGVGDSSTTSVGQAGLILQSAGALAAKSSSDAVKSNPCGKRRDEHFADARLHKSTQLGRTGGTRVRSTGVRRSGAKAKNRDRLFFLGSRPRTGGELSCASAAAFVLTFLLLSGKKREAGNPTRLQRQQQVVGDGERKYKSAFVD